MTSAPPYTAETGRVARSSRLPPRGRLPQHELDLLVADEELVPVLHLLALDPLLVEPGAIRGAEILDVVGALVAHDDGVLPAHLAGVDDEVAVLAPADDEPVLGDAVQGPALGHEVELATSPRVVVGKWPVEDVQGV